MTPREQRFQKAYNALVRAFFEGTLAKGTCLACACGNIIFDAVGDPVTKEELVQEIKWSNDPREGQILDKSIQADKLWAEKRGYSSYSYERKEYQFEALPDFKDEINEAGYTAEEFAKIETAFERNTRIRFSEYPDYTEQDILEDQYVGLCAVVDVLMELEGGSEGGDKFKQKFREHPKLQTA